MLQKQLLVLFSIKKCKIVNNHSSSSQRSLQPTESRYSTFGRELLAIYLAVKHFRHLKIMMSSSSPTTSCWRLACTLIQIATPIVRSANWILFYSSVPTFITFVALRMQLLMRSCVSLSMHFISCWCGFCCNGQQASTSRPPQGQGFSGDFCLKMCLFLTAMAHFSAKSQLASTIHLYNRICLSQIHISRKFLLCQKFLFDPDKNAMFLTLENLPKPDLYVAWRSGISRSRRCQWLVEESPPQLLKEFTAENIFNCDKTGLFYRCLPDRTHA